MKNILIRADSSSDIGAGHIMRCLVLAQQYTKYNVIFATQNLPNNLNAEIIKQNYQLINLNSNSCEEILLLIIKYKIDMIIIDHYLIDYIYESMIKKTTGITIFSLDDTYKKHTCDILLNHNINAEEKRYKNLVPSNCTIKCGKKHMLLRKEFYLEKKINITTDKKHIQIFISMGGADVSQLNIPILEILNHINKIKINLVTTDANQNINKLRSYIENKPWINLHINSTQIAKLINHSDFCITTSSSSAGEIIFMNKPFVAVKIVPNQTNMYNYLLQNNYNVLEKFDTKIMLFHIKKLIKETCEL